MSHKHQAVVLPRYADLEDEGAPLLLASGDAKRDIQGFSEGNLVEEQPAEDDRCAAGRRGFCARWRARRCAWKSKEPECENRRCVRRRRITRFFMFLLSAALVFHLVKFAYMVYKLPQKIECEDLTDRKTTLELAYNDRNPLFLHRSLSTGEFSVVRDEAVTPGTFQLQLQFADLEGTDASVVCHGKFKKAWMFGAFTKDEEGTLPSIEKATVILPAASDAATPFIGFGLGGHGKKRHGHCEEKMIRKFLNLKKEHDGEEEDD